MEKLKKNVKKLKRKEKSKMNKKTMRLLLIEDDLKECNKFKELTKTREDIEFIGITNSAIDALKYVKKFMPDGIILDLELNNGQGSGFEFLKELRKLKLTINPKVVVTTNVCSDSVYNYLHQNKVDFIFYKKQENYNIKNVINILILLNEYKNNDNDNNDISISNDDEEKTNQIISERINKELDLIGVATYLEGRKYLYDAIFYLITNKNSSEKISMLQYLSSKYKKSSSTISRGMQNAIYHAWRVSSPDDLEKYYTAKINYETGVPTPMDFIYYYYEKIKKML